MKYNKIFCRSPAEVGDPLRRGGKCAGLNPQAYQIRMCTKVNQPDLLGPVAIGQQLK